MTMTPAARTAVAAILLMAMATSSAGQRSEIAAKAEAPTQPPSIVATSSAPTPTPTPEINEADAIMIAKTIYNEARGCGETQQAAVAWAILNRVDDPRFPNTVADVVTQRYQFAYTARSRYTDAQLQIARDVLRRWMSGNDDGRVLPREYCWYSGNGRINIFRTAYKGGTVWDWRLPSPYKT